MRIRAFLSLLALGVAFASPAAAEHRKVVDGYVINIGVVPAPQLLRVDAYENSMHRADAFGATHHVVVGIAEAGTGREVADAQVVVEVVDPRGRTQRVALAPGAPGGHPDYSGLFRFGWSGAYQLRVNVVRAGAAPVNASFAWRQDDY